jgi:hypothetical protein
MTTTKLTLIALMLTIGAGSAMAQTSPSPSPLRSPVSGDPVLHSAKRPTTTAARAAQADKQPPGTENGNQPDRAQAGGGSR